MPQSFLGDSIYGISLDFIKAADALVDTTYFVSVPSNTLCWLKSPMTVKKNYKYKGEERTKTVLVDTEQKPISLSTLAKNTNSFFWYRRKASEGTKGPIVYEFTRRRVRLSADGLPQKEVWAIIRRSIGKNFDSKSESCIIIFHTENEKLWRLGLRKYRCGANSNEFYCFIILGGCWPIKTTCIQVDSSNVQ